MGLFYCCHCNKICGTQLQLKYTVYLKIKRMNEKCRFWHFANRELNCKPFSKTRLQHVTKEGTEKRLSPCLKHKGLWNKWPHFFNESIKIENLKINWSFAILKSWVDTFVYFRHLLPTIDIIKTKVQEVVLTLATFS